MTSEEFAEFIRERITELRLEKDVSEHKMSLDLDKSGAYIRDITCEGSSPSVNALADIINYFDMTPSEFFAPLEDRGTPYRNLCDRLRKLSAEDLGKVDLFVSWIEQ